MTTAELNEMRKLSHELMYDWDAAKYQRYLELSCKEHEEYKAKAEPDLKKFYEAHIKGKKPSEVSAEDWDWFSDYHKDVYGYRPRWYTYTDIGYIGG